MKKVSYHRTTLKINDKKEGEPLEHKIRRAMNNKEPIGEDAPLIYTEKQAGVSPGHNIRTDRFEVAIDGITTMNKSYKARSEEKGKVIELNDDIVGKKNTESDSV